MTGPAFAQGLPALHDVTGVAGTDVLNLRAAPDAGAELLGSLAPNARGVEVTALSPDGKWGQVNLAETSGWAAMRFLARQPGPDWTALQTPMRCSGTEPFWGLDFNATEANMTLREMDAEALPLWITWVAPAAGQTGTVGIALEGPARTGFATLTARICSDGMSDRQYGLSLTLFLNGVGASTAEASGLSGCCALVP